MREILFRGKRVDSGEWAHGDLMHCNEIRSKREMTCIWFPADDGLTHEAHIDPDTVGQYTGLMDKNGKRIFEGDILRYQINIKTAIVGKIVFMCGAFVFASEELDRECEIAFATFADDEISMSQHCIEVIGNIHDHPELMGE